MGELGSDESPVGTAENKRGEQTFHRLSGTSRVFFDLAPTDKKSLGYYQSPL